MSKISEYKHAYTCTSYLDHVTRT